MRKRTAKYIFEKLMWGIIMFLPIIGYILTLTGNKELENTLTTSNFINYINTAGWLNPVTYGDIYKNLYDLFNKTLTRLLGNNELNQTLSFLGAWFIIIEILHLTVDVLLFIPRWAHGVMDNFLSKTGGKD